MVDKLRHVGFYLASLALGILSIFSTNSHAPRRVLFSSTRDIAGEPDSPSGADDRAWLSKIVSGRIIFDSNRNGSFGIYCIGLDGGDLRCLVNTDRHEMYPAPSPCGKLVAFARAEHPGRNAPSEIYLIGADGKNECLIARNGTFPTFSSSGSQIIFERGRSRVMTVDIHSGEEQELFPRENASFCGYEIAKPQLSADGRYLYFISDRKGRWNVWGVDLRSGRDFWVGAGCEPSPNVDGSKVAWVRKASFFGRTEVVEKEILAAQPTVRRLVAANGFKYFPSLAFDGRLLLYGSGGSREWIHSKTRYQISISDLSTGRTLQLTDDGFVNRWPRLLLST